MTLVRARRSRRLRSAAFLAGICLLAAACSSKSDSATKTATADSGSTGSGAAAGSVDGAKAKVAEFEKLVSTWPGPTEPVKAVSGKKIGIVTCGVTSEACTRMAVGITEAATALGWSVIETYNPPNLTPDDENAALLRMIDAGANGIVCVCIPRPLLTETLAKAKAKNVSFVTVRSESDKYTPPDDVKLGKGERLAGEMMADFVIADSDGKAKLIMIRDDDFDILKDISDGFKETIAKCSGCSIVEEVNIPTATVFNDIVSTTTNLLRRHPDTTYVYGTFDAEARLVVSSLNETGMLGKVKIVGGTGGEKASLDLIRNDPPVDFVATTGAPQEWAGWAGVDNLLRLFQNQPLVTNTNRPLLITKNNAPEQSYTGDEQGGIDFRAEYKKLWGLS